MNFNIIVAIRNDQVNKKGLASIYVAIFAGSKRLAKISTGYKIHPKDWDKSKQRIKPGSPDSKIVNYAIGSFVSKLRTHILQQSIINKVTDLKVILQGIDFKKFQSLLKN